MSGRAAAVTAIGGRSGLVASDDGELRVTLRRSSGGATPEQLVAAACAADFLQQLHDAAGRAGIALAADSNVTATIICGTAPVLRLNIDLPGMRSGPASELVRAARADWRYASVVAGHINVVFDIA